MLTTKQTIMLKDTWGHNKFSIFDEELNKILHIKLISNNIGIFCSDG